MSSRLVFVLCALACGGLQAQSFGVLDPDTLQLSPWVMTGNPNNNGFAHWDNHEGRVLRLGGALQHSFVTYGLSTISYVAKSTASATDKLIIEVDGVQHEVDIAPRLPSANWGQRTQDENGEWSTYEEFTFQGNSPQPTNIRIWFNGHNGQGVISELRWEENDPPLALPSALPVQLNFYDFVGLGLQRCWYAFDAQGLSEETDQSFEGVFDHQSFVPYRIVLQVDSDYVAPAGNSGAATVLTGWSEDGGLTTRQVFSEPFVAGAFNSHVATNTRIWANNVPDAGLGGIADNAGREFSFVRANLAGHSGGGKVVGLYVYGWPSLAVLGAPDVSASYLGPPTDSVTITVTE